MTSPGDARKIMQGCDLTADCPATEHASDCWRGQITAASPLPTDEDARGLLAAIADISDGLEHYEPTDHARRSVRSLRIVLDAARRSAVSTPSEEERDLIERVRYYAEMAVSDVGMWDEVARLVKVLDRLAAVSAPPTITDEARARARDAVRKEMRSRTYDRHAYDDDVFEEGVADIADAALRAALGGEEKTQ